MTYFQSLGVTLAAIAVLAIIVGGLSFLASVFPITAAVILVIGIVMLLAAMVWDLSNRGI